MNIGYNDYYFEKDGKPWLPIMGEMHYSRTDRRHWKRSLYTMKAGGVQVVASYTIWIHHEEIEGRYDFSGNKDLRAFAKEVQAAGLYLFLRIGPWVHGEVRNGGFPDWLFDKAEREGFELRRYNEPYFAEARKYYQKIYEQVEGLFLKDGGPIIGVQIGNEFNTICGGVSGEEGDPYIRHLTDMAREIGFDVPIYTATGWGNAGTGGLIKVWGGYPARPWLPTSDELPPTENYLFSFNRNDANIGSNSAVLQKLMADSASGFPYATAELGGGCQITDRRRPIVAGKDVAAMAFVKMASGANLLGFYMFHGGTNPHGILTTLEETTNRKGVTGCLSVLPKYGYDFQAPLNEFGDINDRYTELRLLLLPVNDFGTDICTMRTFLPEDAPTDPADFDTLRYAVRHNGKRGFVFVNNYQRRYSMKNHENAVLTVKLDNETVTFPAVDIKDGQFFMWPVNMPVGDGVIKTATAAPFCLLNNKTYVFYGEHNPVFTYEKEPTNAEVLWIPRCDAERAQKVKIDNKDYLVVSDAVVLSYPDGVKVYSTEKPVLKVYPAFDKTPVGYKHLDDDNNFAVYEKEVYRDCKVDTDIRFVSGDDDKKRFVIDLSYDGVLPEDIYLNIKFEGNYITTFVDGLCATDNYYNSTPFTVGLARYAYPREVEVVIDALKADKDLYLQYDPRKDGKDACDLLGVDIRVKQVHNLIW